MTNLVDKVTYDSAAMKQVYKDLLPFVQSASPIFFWGETGSGMGFYARAVHEASRKEGNLLRKPCFELDEKTLQEQLFGINEQKGWLEEFNNGTIFFKRITKASPAIQKTLLHLLEIQSVDGRIEFSRKGKTETLEVNVRFVFSMAHDFAEAIQDQLLSRSFDDFFRKRGKIIHLFPLRERKEDIVIFAEHLLKKLSQDNKQPKPFLDESAKQLLTNYRWPGNFHELKEVLSNILSQHPGITKISPDHIPEYIVHSEITGEQYSFKLKNGERVTGTVRSHFLRIQKKDKNKIQVNMGDVVEIYREVDAVFAPPKFKHFSIKLKDGNRIIADKILDKSITIKTSFEDSYQIDVEKLDSVLLL